MRRNSPARRFRGENRCSRVHSRREEKHESETAARAIRGRGTNPYGPERALASVGSRDANAEHKVYDKDAICDYPQAGERILGRKNLQALRSHHPSKPSGFKVKRIVGNGDLGITEYTITYQGRAAYTVSILEFRNGKVVHETQYFADPFEAPAWRRQWVQRTG
jgi:SnoaL-like domain